ncbi:MAG: cereblon family protein [Pseudomonadales bacterium]|nr:cereblon family protein [Pseudomonadales bacterium]
MIGLPPPSPVDKTPRCLELGDEDPVAKILEAMKSDDESLKKNAILCKQCDHVITFPEDLITINDRFIHTFTNPSGLQFDIQCYHSAEGALVSGKPTDFFTWFKGYAWQFCYCKNCGNHIGWFYSNQEDQFFGLNLATLKGDI